MKMLFNLIFFVSLLSCNKSKSDNPPVPKDPGWKKQSSGTTKALNYIHFTSVNNGFVFGDEGRGLKTTDGGATWTPFNAGTNSLLICGTFVNENIGFAAGNATVIRTTDGGNTWTVAATPPTGFIFGIAFSSSTMGYALNNSGQLFKSTDGGNNWSVGTTPSPEGRGIYFSNLSIGIIIGLNGTVLKTINGGSSWTSVAPAGTESTTFTAVTSSDANTFYLADHIGKVYKSTDAGSTWTLLNSGVSAALRDIKFNGQFGIAVGDNGTIISTSNGGTEWKTYTPLVTDLINSVYVLSNEKAFAVGWNGTLLAFSK